MGFRLPLLALFVLLNLFAYLALRRTIAAWVRAEDRRRRLTRVIGLGVLLLNFPLAAFFVRGLDASLRQVPAPLLRVFFYPATAWLTTILAFFLIAGPPTLLWMIAKGIATVFRRKQQPVLNPSADPPRRQPVQAPLLARRSFLAGSAGLLIPGIYGISTYGVYGALDEVDVSPELSIPIPDLPKSLDGLTLVQISDLHAGPYIRERELQHVVHLVNQLRPDLVVITGDVLDRHLDSLPDAVRGLTGIRSPLGVFTVLGNHDISADRYSFSKQYRGGINIASGLESVGIRTLRNQVTYLGSGQDRVALLGLDWLSENLSGPNFFRYQAPETRRQLRRMTAETGPEIPKILLAHHPDTFADAIPMGIAFTLSGHTHGGGQVILGSWDGVPLGLGVFRFKYLSGLYQEAGCSLYVNRGIGYLGIPIRLNCPPEISRFRLVRSASAPPPDVA